jgi:fucose permease
MPTSLGSINRTRPALLLVGLSFLAFISLGLPDGLLGVAWPSIAGDFGLALGALGLLPLVFSVGYLATSVNTGRLAGTLGIGGLLFASSLLVTGGLLAYALASQFGLVLLGALLIGTGSGAIDAGLNTYASFRFSPRLINWMHAFYGLGAMAGPLLMTAFLTTGFSWQWGYLAVAGLLAVMSICFGISRHIWSADMAGQDANQQPEATAGNSVGTALRRPAVWLGMLIFFVYTGVEVSAGQWAYSLFTAGRAMAPELAGLAVGAYWASLTLGRILFGMLAGRWSADALVRWCMLGAMLATLLIWLDLGSWPDLLSLALLGGMFAPIFPLLVNRTPERLGRALAMHAVGLQVAAANLGAALLPAAIGGLVTISEIGVIAACLAGLSLSLFLLHEDVLRRARRLNSHR